MSLDKFVTRTKKIKENNITEESIQKCLETTFKIPSFRDKQHEIIKSVLLEKTDVCAILATGTGKSLCYQLPAVMQQGITIVISPLIALMHDQVTSLISLGVVVERLDSQQKVSVQNKIYKDLEFGNPTIKILYTTPEQVTGKLFDSRKTCYAKNMLAMFAIDEAHCISNWGLNFRKSYRRLDLLKKTFRDVPMIALTATATPKVRKDIIDTLGLKNPKVFVSTFNRPEIMYEFRIDVRDSEKDLCDFLQDHANECGIIYARTKKNVVSLVEKLKSAGYLAEGYHSEINKTEKKNIQNAWISGKIHIIVATISFGMGIDKSNVRFVVHFGLPDSIEAFYQQSGRAGRDKQKSLSVLYFSIEEKNTVEFLIGKESENQDGEIRTIQMDSFEKFVELCTTTGCRRKFILQYLQQDV
jgi:RecQ family ATP-dependent DNA helicase